MFRLFSRFDMIFSPFFLIFFVFFFGMLDFFYFSSFFLKFFKEILNILKTFFLTLKPKGYTDFSLTFLSFIFVFIFLFNHLGVLPFGFAATSQIRVVIFLRFQIWVSLIMFFLLKNSKYFLSHCIPEGAPSALVVVLFVIEIVRNLIRPLTLAVRLCANILAGHLLMILLAQLTIIFNTSFQFYLILNIIEIFVGLIQSYIFVTLLALYHSELN